MAECESDETSNTKLVNAAMASEDVNMDENLTMEGTSSDGESKSESNRKAEARKRARERMRLFRQRVAANSEEEREKKEKNRERMQETRRSMDETILQAMREKNAERKREASRTMDEATRQAMREKDCERNRETRRTMDEATVQAMREKDCERKREASRTMDEATRQAMRERNCERKREASRTMDEATAQAMREKDCERKREASRTMDEATRQAMREKDCERKREASRTMDEATRQAMREKNAERNKETRRTMSMDDATVEALRAETADRKRCFRMRMDEMEREVRREQNQLMEDIDPPDRTDVMETESIGCRNSRSRTRRQKPRLALDVSQQPQLNYIGKMNIKCTECGALHFEGEKTSSANKFNSCCNFGNVKVEVFPKYPDLFQKYLTSMDRKYVNFRQSIRNYNSALAMASMGAQLDIPRGLGPYCFRIHGQIYHNAGPLHPEHGQRPQYGQIYVLDTDMAAEERLRNPANTDCDADFMAELSQFLHSKNTYAKSYYMMSEVEKEENAKAITENREAKPVRMVFDTTLPVDKRRYNVPVVNEVAVVFVGHDDEVPPTRSLAVHNKESGLKIIKDIDKVCDPMTYPLFFPTGGEGWHPGLTKKKSGRKRTRISQKEYYCYLLFTRTGEFNPLHHANKLFQQYIVDSWVKVEQNRLNYDRTHQAEFRIESYKGLQDFLMGDDQIQGPPGRRIVLPSSYKGGPRDMHQSYQDAMAIVAKYGKPDYFLTMTCNPHWKEVTEQLNPGQTASDRPDIIARVFELKLQVLMDKLLKEHVLGEVLAHVAVIEFQKRGLPHCHLLLIMKSGSKPRSTADIDKAICAEIPEPVEHPELHQIVTSCMVHRPCGAYNPNSPCMKDGKCTKQYPKDFCDSTNMDGDSYPRYRRRNDGRTIQSGTYQVDNRWIVPYNPYLSKLFGCHINLEVCALITAVKYLYKYVYKGSDRASLKIVRNVDGEEQEIMDEISAHLNARYVCAPEAAHRIFGNDMQRRSHTVYRLQIHLPEEQQVTFEQGKEQQALLAAREKKTNLTAYFEMNSKCEEVFKNPSSVQAGMVDSRNISYIDMPNFFTFDKKEWKPRKHCGKQLGRMYAVNPRDKERFCLRLLLLHRKGCKSYEDLRTVNGQIFDSFVDAAKAMDLLITDDYYDKCMEEGVGFQMPSQLRSLFACLLAFTELNNPVELWGKYREELAADYLYQGSTPENSIGLAYFDIADKLSLAGIHLQSIIPAPGIRPLLPSQQFDFEGSKKKGEEMYETLNDGQKKFVDAVLESLESTDNRLFFVDGPGGSGKTYVYTVLNHILRGQKLTVMNVAWTGIAANLLPEGRTVNSAFKLVVANGNKSSSMKRQSKEAKILETVDCIVWDEVSMTPKCALDAVDVLLQDIMQTSKSFGGKMIILGGDFRQVLPIVNRGTQQDIIDAVIKSSSTWEQFQTYTLSDNMRLTTGNREWNKFLLDVGNGKHCVENNTKVALPKDVISSGDIIDDIYGDILSTLNAKALTERCILSAKNMDVFRINETVLEKIPGNQRCYLSIDEVQSDGTHESDAEALNFPTEFLHTMTPTGMPPHSLHLKEGAIVMLLRNLDVKNGLCNGSRFIVAQMGDHILGCKHAYGDRKGDFVLIPRIDCYYDQNIPFRLRRRQFPVRLAFAMTIHKSQGQSFSKVGVDLTDDVFSHGQLYVALSRVRSMEGIKIMCSDSEVDNIVYKDVL